MMCDCRICCAQPARGVIIKKQNKLRHGNEWRKKNKGNNDNRKNNNSHEFPKSLLSFATEDFWYKEPWREEGIVDGRVGEVGRGWWRERDDENQI